MPNTNFQTFHQMGQAINEVVRQATGRDNVQNIDMEHITVAQNHYYQDVDMSGRVVSFHAGAAGLPLEKCVVQIEPVQDLHGYDHPWPAGGGKNLLGFKIPNGRIATCGVTITQNNDGSITLNGTSNTELAWNKSQGAETFAPQKLTAGTKYTLSGSANKPQNQTYIQLVYKDDVTGEIVSIVSQNATPTSITPTNNCTYDSAYCTIKSGVSFSNETLHPQFEVGNATDYAPYSNICPITGWTGANVYVSPTTDAADGQTYSITFPSEAGTVYGGTLDVVNGVLTVDRKTVVIDGSVTGWETGYGNANYVPLTRFTSDQVKQAATGVERSALCLTNRFKPISSSWSESLKINNEVCFGVSNDDYFVFNTGVRISDVPAWLNENPINFVYELATPITYQLTPTEITTLLGVNNIWSDAGDIEVKFKDIKELY